MTKDIAIKFFQGEEGERLAKKLKSLGPDLLNDEDFVKAEFVNIFKNRNANKIIVER